MKTIHRYVLAINIQPQEDSYVEMPDGAEILEIQHSRFGGMNLEIWAIVDTEASMVKKQFLVYGTGKTLPNYDFGIYRATVTTHSGQFVWHIFEVL